MTETTNDYREVWYAPEEKIRIIRVEVTTSARTAERSHLCGPVAGLLQAEAMVAVASMSSDLQPDESLSLRLQLPQGELQGVLMECTVDGALRGCTFKKVLPQLDEQNESDEVIARKALGSVAVGRVVVSTHQDSTTSSFRSRADDDGPISMANVVETYYEACSQRTSRQFIFASSQDGYLEKACGLRLEWMPDASMNELDLIEGLMRCDTIEEMLSLGTSTEEIMRAMKIGRIIQAAQPRPLRFECRCSQERVKAMVCALPDVDLQALIDKNEPAQIFCHLCGRNFLFPIDALKTILTSRHPKQS